MKILLKTAVYTFVLIVLNCLSALADEKEAKKPTGFNSGIYCSKSGKINVYIDRINKKTNALILLSNDAGQVFYRELVPNYYNKFARALNVDQLEGGHYILKVTIGNETLSKSILVSEKKVERALAIE